MANLNQTPKIALITGSSRGLGRSTAVHLGKRGAGVVVTYHSQEGQAREVVAEIEASGGSAVALQLDAGKVSSFDGFITLLSQALEEKWNVKTFDHLVNNAGTALHKPFAETTEEEFDTLLNVHFKGVYFLTQKLLPLINDGGRIVNISSGLTRFSYPGSSAYAAMKGAVEVLTRYWAKELGVRGIVVNTVAPGAVETDFGGGYLRGNEELKKMISMVTALGRPGVPEDIGPMIAALLGEENRWISAQRIEVSGGMNP